MYNGCKIRLFYVYDEKGQRFYPDANKPRIPD